MHGMGEHVEYARCLQYEAVFVNQQFHFASVVSVSKDPDIPTHCKSHTGFAGCFHARALRPQTIGLRINSLFPSAVLQDRILRRHRGTKRNVVLFH